MVAADTTKNENPEIVNEFTYSKSDFLESVKPFEKLYALKNNPLVYEQELQRLIDNGKAVGINFKKFYKAYCDTNERIKRTTAVTADKNAQQYTDFPSQPLLLRCEPWSCGSDGVYRYVNCEPVYACYHPIMPVTILKNIDTGDEKIRIAYFLDGFWKCHIFSRSVLSSTKKAVDELAKHGIDITSDSAKYLVAFIRDVLNLNRDILPRENSVCRLGWIDGYGFSPYAENLIYDGEASFAEIYNAISPHGDYEAWIETANKCRHDSLKARLIMDASFASVMLKDLGSLPFFVHLWGDESGTGKTVALLLAASVWGDPTMGKYVKTFDSTAVGNERIAAFLNSLPYFIDEMQLAKDKNGRNNFSVYRLTQGTGRLRGEKSGGIDSTATWNNCFITTGESPLTKNSDGAGALNRVIDIECNSRVLKKELCDEVLTVINKSYGHGGKDFVSFFSEQKVKDEAKKLFKNFKAELTSYGFTGKQTMAGAILLTADILASYSIFDKDEPLEVKDLAEFLQIEKDVSLGERAYQYICGWVSTNSKRFDSGEENRSEIYGKFSEENEWVYIIKSVFDRTMEREGFSTRAVLNWLNRKNLIRTSAETKSIATRIDGKVTRCIALKLPNDCGEGEIISGRTPDIETDFDGGVPF